MKCEARKKRPDFRFFYARYPSVIFCQATLQNELYEGFCSHPCYDKGRCLDISCKAVSRKSKCEIKVSKSRSAREKNSYMRNLKNAIY